MLLNLVLQVVLGFLSEGLHFLLLLLVVGLQSGCHGGHWLLSLLVPISNELVIDHRGGRGLLLAHGFVLVEVARRGQLLGSVDSEPLALHALVEGAGISDSMFLLHPLSLLQQLVQVPQLCVLRLRIAQLLAPYRSVELLQIFRFFFALLSRHSRLRHRYVSPRERTVCRGVLGNPEPLSDVDGVKEVGGERVVLLGLLRQVHHRKGSEGRHCYEEKRLLEDVDVFLEDALVEIVCRLDVGFAPVVVTDDVH